MSDIASIKTRIESRIRVLSQPDGKHIYNASGIHAGIEKCGECGRLWELKDLLHWFEGIDTGAIPTDLFAASKALKRAAEEEGLTPRDDMAEYRRAMHRGYPDPRPPSSEDCGGSGNPHEYRIACKVCGERGTLRLSIDHYPGPPVEYVTPEANKARP